jgi:hypothetical protein
MEQKSNLLIFFASIAPEGISKKRISERVLDYSRSLQLLSEYAQSLDLEIQVVENTLGGLQSWVEHGLYQDSEINISFTGENSGLSNKGLGELDMAIFVESLIDLAKYRKVIWFSGRHLLTTEASLKISISSSADLVVSNPDFYFLNGERIETEKKGLLNDMMFSMTSKVFLNYLSIYRESKREILVQNLGSEQILHDFVERTQPSVQWLTNLGVLRRENTVKWRWIETSKWHFC